MTHVVVIGAGVGGLGAAVRLVGAGCDVTVLEAAKTIGGKLNIEASDGHTFDTGPSLMTMPFTLADTLAAADVRLDNVLELLPVEPICRYRWHDGSRLETWSDDDRTAAELERFEHGAGQEWHALLEQGRRTWEMSLPLFLSEPVGSFIDIARRSGKPIDPRDIQAHVTLSQIAQRRFRDPRLQQVIERFATYAGADPARAPGTLSVIPYTETAFGAWHPRGGMHRIAEVLRDVIVERGGTVRTGTTVTRVLIDGGVATGVELADGERIDADAVISNVDASHLYGSLLDAPDEARRVADTPQSVSGFVLMLAMEGKTPELAHHNIWFPRDYRAEFADVFDDPQPPHDPAIYVCNPAVTDPSCAPDGDESWFVLVNAPRNGPVDWDALGERYQEHLLDRLDALGLEARARAKWIVRRTPADLERLTGAPGGAIYGTASMGPRSAFLRPRNESPVAKRLYLATGSAHPGGGVPLVLLSGKIAADLVLRDCG
ncbi:MAG: phytoene desaturase family protein [Actinobacteria bacterium]|nr:phytoene desaturase family protein [Actinomycetota bacterium]